MVDVPLINKKGEARINAGVSMLQLHGTVSVGITDKIAIQTFAGTQGNAYFAQEAIGYYKDLGNKKVMEIYSGFGYGYADVYYDPNPGFLRGHYKLYFTQFNFGKVDCEFAHADVGFAVKAGLLHSKLTDNNYYSRSIFPPDSHGTYIDNCLLVEPQVFARLGGEHFKLNIQIGATGLKKFTNKDKWMPNYPINFGLGLNCRF